MNLILAFTDHASQSWGKILMSILILITIAGTDKRVSYHPTHEAEIRWIFPLALLAAQRKHYSDCMIRIPSHLSIYPLGLLPIINAMPSLPYQSLIYIPRNVWPHFWGLERLFWGTRSLTALASLWVTHSDRYRPTKPAYPFPYIYIESRRFIVSLSRSLVVVSSSDRALNNSRTDFGIAWLVYGYTYHTVSFVDPS